MPWRSCRGSACAAPTIGGAAASATCPSSAATCRSPRSPTKSKSDGPGRVRALVTVAGNPVLSAPNGRRLDRALGTLEHVVSIDGYLNETTRHAHVLLPPASPLSRGHYDLALLRLRGAQRGEVLGTGHPTTGVGAARLGDPRRARRRGSSSRVRFAGSRVLAARAVAAGADRRRAAPHRPPPADAGEAAPVSARDGSRAARAGALRGSHRHARSHGRCCARRTLLREARAQLLVDADRETTGELVLIGRRQLRGNNSWMHNSRRLVKGPPRCTLLVHPDDAASRHLANGDLARLGSETGTVVVPVEVTDAMLARRRQPAARMGSRSRRHPPGRRARTRRRERQRRDERRASRHAQRQRRLQWPRGHAPARRRAGASVAIYRISRSVHLGSLSHAS